MHSRFWTFCAAGNVLLFLCSTTVLYYNDRLSSTTTMSLTHRSVSGWAKGLNVWRDYYRDMAVVPEGYSDFLAVGLEAVGCTGIERSPACTCLSTAHETGQSQCPSAAYEQLQHCFMQVRPVVEIDELERSLNPFALLDTMNMWGMMGSVLIWVRMYVYREDESMPYSLQVVLGIFAAMIHCSVMEPTVDSFLVYIALVLVMSFISYLHRLDKEWWVSAYHVQYMFTVPNLVIMQNIIAQKRDFSFIAFSAMASVTFGILTFAKTLLEQISKESFELSCIHNVNRMVLFSIFLVLTMSSYGAAGTQYFQSATVVTAVCALHLILGLFGTSNIKRTYFMELMFRIIISLNMLMELGIANDEISRQ
jgi:hypothetical protein